MRSLGDEGAVVLRFSSNSLRQRWQEFRDGGASWDYDEYLPHVTISYNAGHIDVTEIAPYEGVLIFGPERFAAVDDDWADDIHEKVTATH